MQILIVGGGKVGLTLTQMLTSEEHNVTVVDANLQVLQRIQEECDAMAVHGHGAARAVLQQAGAAKAQLLIAATDKDEVNLLSCLVARKLGCQNTIARVRSTEYADNIDLLREELGLSFAVNPEKACAREIFSLLQLPSFLAREQFSAGQVEIVQLKISAASPLVGLALHSLHSATHQRVLVCAVCRAGRVSIPGGSFVLQQGDDIFVATEESKLAALVKSLGLATHKTTQVSIVGGGLLGYYLGQLLLHSHVGVKIIEKNRQRCLTLSQLLPQADIIHGDGTDQELLLAEGVARADALVALTGIDEENIILSMYARHLGVHTTITKCSHSQYAQMFTEMNLGSIVSPKMNCAQDIVRYVRTINSSMGSQMLTLRHLAGGQAQALEFRASAGFAGLNIALAKLKLKKGVLIACICRGRSAIIPSGETCIMQGDAVVVVALAGCRVYSLGEVLQE